MLWSSVPKDHIANVYLINNAEVVFVFSCTGVFSVAFSHVIYMYFVI